MRRTTPRWYLNAAAVVALAIAQPALPGHNPGIFLDASKGPIDYRRAEIAPRNACNDLRASVIEVEGAPVSIVSVNEMNAGGSSHRFCRVFGIIAPEIQFEVALPVLWNSRLYMRDNGGYGGQPIDAPDRVKLRDEAVRNGFIAVQTNTGHDAVGEPLATFAHNNIGKLTDYGFRAVHLTAVAAKSLANSYYGRTPSYSYFDGCSTGGRQGLMSAQRYPGDFDGIVASAPVNDFTGQLSWHAWNGKHLAAAPLTLAQAVGLGQAVMELCDARDGLRDGLITDPRDCPFDPIRHAPRTGPNALNDAQIQALQAVYGGMKVRGRAVFPGLPVGAEAADMSGRTGWADWLVEDPNDARDLRIIPRGKSRQFAYGESFIRYFANQPISRPELDLRSFDFDTEYRPSVLLHELVDAVDPDLRAFQAGGGKIVFYHGWSDAALNAMSSINYYEAVRKTVPNSDNFIRLFMVPGMWHCRGGVGPNEIDGITAVINWVEAGQAPESLLAIERAPARGEGVRPVIRARPVCAYPRVAIWDRVGDPKQSSSFRCSMPAKGR